MGEGSGALTFFDEADASLITVVPRRVCTGASRQDGSEKKCFHEVSFIEGRMRIASTWALPFPNDVIWRTPSRSCLDVGHRNRQAKLPGRIECVAKLREHGPFVSG